MQNNRILIFSWNDLTTGIEEELIKKGYDVTSVLKIEKREDVKGYDLVLHWNESSLGEGRDFAKYIQKQGIKYYIYQHGIGGVSRCYYPFNEEVVADKAFVWGEATKDQLIQVGCKKDIIITGCPITLPQRVPHKGINVVFAPMKKSEGEIENYQVNAKLRQLTEVKVITKLLNEESTIGIYQNEVISDRRLPGHMKSVLDVLKIADLVVSLEDSTFEFLAESMDIPVVVADIVPPRITNGDERYLKFIRRKSNACKKTDLDNLIPTIHQQLKNPKELSKQREYVRIYEGGFDKDPVKEFCNIIENDFPNRPRNRKP